MYRNGANLLLISIIWEVPSGVEPLCKVLQTSA